MRGDLPTTGAMSMPDIVAGAFSMYMKAPAAWFALALVSLVVEFAVQLAVGTRVDLGANPTSKQLQDAFPVLGVAGAIAALAQLFTHIAVVVGATEVLRGGSLSLRQGYLTALQRYVPVLIPVVGVFLLASILLGTIVLIPLAFYLVVNWSLLVQAIVAEGFSPFRALGRSRQIVRGQWWRTLGIILAIWILSAILPSLIAGAVTRPFDLLWLSAAGAAFAGAVAEPFRSIAQTLLYADLRTRKGERPFVAPAKELP